jgi:hypothetical protein
MERERSHFVVRTFVMAEMFAWLWGLGWEWGDRVFHAYEYSKTRRLCGSLTENSTPSFVIFWKDDNKRYEEGDDKNFEQSSKEPPHSSLLRKETACCETDTSSERNEDFKSPLNNFIDLGRTDHASLHMSS